MVPSHCSSVGSLPSDEDFAIKALVHVVARPGVIDSLHYIVVSDKIMGEEYKPLRNLLAQQFDLVSATI